MTDIQEDHEHPKFPHIENLDRVPEVLEGIIQITEKIDGFNARFGRTSTGEFWMGTRNQLIPLDTIDAAQGFARYALSKQEDVDKGITYFGEWAGKGIQKRIDYGRPDFHLFAVMRNGRLQIPTSIYVEGTLLEMSTVVPLHWGTNPGIEELEKMRTRENTEGIVITPWPTMFNKYGQVTIAKFKNPTFEERKSQREQRPRPDLSSLEAIVEEHVTRERMLHVFDHIIAQFDRGITEPWQIEHTGTYLQMFYTDILEDAREEIEALDPEMRRSLGKMMNKPAKALRDEYLHTLFAEHEHGGEG